MEQLELKLTVRFGFSLLIILTAFAILSAARHGSPSQPCPKLTSGSFALSPWRIATSAISSAVGAKDILSCGDGQHSEACNEIQPTHALLHAGLVGIGHSHRG